MQDGIPCRILDVPTLPTPILHHLSNHRLHDAPTRHLQCQVENNKGKEDKDSSLQQQIHQIAHLQDHQLQQQRQGN